MSDEGQHLDNVRGYPVQIELETLQKAQVHMSFGVETSLSDRIAASDENYGFRYVEGPSRTLGERIGLSRRLESAW